MTWDHTESGTVGDEMSIILDRTIAHQKEGANPISAVRTLPDSCVESSNAGRQGVNTSWGLRASEGPFDRVFLAVEITRVMAGPESTRCSSHESAVETQSRIVQSIFRGPIHPGVQNALCFIHVYE